MDLSLPSKVCGIWKGYSPEFQSTYEAGSQALKQLLPKFDRYVWSQYDLVGTPANPKYQRLHVRLLRELAQGDYDSLFVYYADKFERQIYMPFGLTYRLIHAPTTMMMGILIFNTLFIFLVLSFSRRILSRRIKYEDEEHMWFCGYYVRALCFLR